MSTTSDENHNFCAGTNVGAVVSAAERARRRGGQLWDLGAAFNHWMYVVLWTLIDGLPVPRKEADQSFAVLHGHAGDVIVDPQLRFEKLSELAEIAKRWCALDDEWLFDIWQSEFTAVFNSMKYGQTDPAVAWQEYVQRLREQSAAILAACRNWVYTLPCADYERLAILLGAHVDQLQHGLTVPNEPPTAHPLASESPPPNFGSAQSAPCPSAEKEQMLTAIRATPRTASATENLWRQELVRLWETLDIGEVPDIGELPDTDVEQLAGPLTIALRRQFLDRYYHVVPKEARVSVELNPPMVWIDDESYPLPTEGHAQYLALLLSRLDEYISFPTAKASISTPIDDNSTRFIANFPPIVHQLLDKGSHKGYRIRRESLQRGVTNS